MVLQTKSFINRQPDYTDLDLDFIAHPTTGDIVRKRGEDAIKRAVRNLVMTNFYDRPFRSYIGSNVRKLLFENPDVITINNLQDAIIEVIRNYEPRVNVLQVDVGLSEDYNAFEVSISFMIINRNLPVTINIFLERIR